MDCPLRGGEGVKGLSTKDKRTLSPKIVEKKNCQNPFPAFQGRKKKFKRPKKGLKQEEN